jgi:hypothetical protein
LVSWILIGIDGRELMKETTSLDIHTVHACRACRRSEKPGAATTLAAIAAALGLIAACGAPADTSPLPDSIGDWIAGESSEYVGEDLFVYINGGAEIYHEHGFDRIEVREYSRGDERVAVELYTMSGSAYGIYSYARSQKGLPIDIAAGGTIAGYYLHTWSGRHLVAVTSHTSSPDVRAAVVEIGRGIGKNLPDTGDIPQLMGLLPVEGCMAGSETYIAGAIGLNAAAPIAAELFGGFAEGATLRCDSTRLVALRWNDPEAAAAALQRAAERASATEGMRSEPGDGDRVVLHFDDDGVAAAARTGDVVRIAVDRGAVPDLDGVFPTNHWGGQG